MRKMLDWMELNPLAMLTIIMGLRDMTYGTMLAFSDPLIAGGNLFKNLSALHAIPQYGIAMAILGALCIYGAIRNKNRMTSRVLGIMSYGWGFVVVGMIVGGQYSLAALYGFAYLALTGYVGYRHKWIRETGIPSPPGGVINKESVI